MTVEGCITVRHDLILADRAAVARLMTQTTLLVMPNNAYVVYRLLGIALKAKSTRQPSRCIRIAIDQLDLHVHRKVVKQSVS